MKVHNKSGMKRGNFKLSLAKLHLPKISVQQNVSFRGIATHIIVFYCNLFLYIVKLYRGTKIT